MSFSVCEAGAMAGSRVSMRSRNISNAALAVLVAIPAFIFQWAFLHRCPDESSKQEDSWQWSRVCEWGRDSPLGLVNAIFFLNVTLLFWVISLVQDSTWVRQTIYRGYDRMYYSLFSGLFRHLLPFTFRNLPSCLSLSYGEPDLTCEQWMQLIDPYWTIIPVMIGYFFSTHPRAESDPWRSRAVMSLLWAWSIRLTHSYFRRENWQWGEREDWRFSQLRKQHPKHWWWMSFFAAYLSQQIFLVGICLPLYAVHSKQTPWNTWDTISCFLCTTGIILAYFSDTQLHMFMSKNQNLTDLGAPPIPVLQEGVWRYSRHPNYVGEQLWWWGLALFAWNLQQGWMAAGAAVNSACLAYVTVLVEKKMLEKASRASAYRKYQETTSVWIPWIKFNAAKKTQ